MMAAKRKLKVYRTPIGFHDAYVAAPSQKAALDAWGASANLFARGVAELVEDPLLTKEPLAHPGEVIRKARGSLNDHIAALPKSAKPSTARKSTKEATQSSPKKPAKRATKPRPSRAKLDAAEASLQRLADEQATEAATLTKREQELERERAAMRKRHAEQQRRGEAVVEKASAAYQAALSKWRIG